MHLAPFLTVAALCLVLSLAHEHHSTRNDIHCPEGSQTTFLHNSYTYIAPLHKFTNITSSFFDILWYGNSPTNSTEGTDNTPGAVRVGLFGTGGTWRETLKAYTSQPDVLEYTYHGIPTTWGSVNTVEFGPYAETMRLESICGGRATFIDLITYICSPDQTKAYDLWYVLHMATFQGLATQVGATVMAGDCPR
ncbi:hypothetical protein C8R43DRAFT_1139915 [Mycena crocata]|nr:hypothetical protein C8R43DRAFT_1139915 [Mycena crocata]